MRLCMFHPNDSPMERGWVGRLDGDRVLHLAAQTLQSLFLGGGSAREHAEYARADVTLLVPIQYPPTVRIFDDAESFVFANATAVGGPGLVVPHGAAPLLLFPRLAGIVGAGAKLAGYSLLAEWRVEAGSPPKDRDFAIGLGPVVSTPDELDPARAEIGVRSGGNEGVRFAVPAFDWEAATAFAAAGTVLRPGDVLAGPSAGPIAGLVGAVELEAADIGVLPQTVA